MRISNETKIGALIVVTVAIFYWGFEFLKGKNIFNHTNDFYVKYDRVDGLKEANYIVIKGFKVGQISGILFNPKDLSKILVHISLYADVKIPKNSIAKIYSIDFLGNKGIDLILSGSEDYYKENDTINGEYEIPITEQLTPIKKSFESILFTIDTLTKKTSRIFDEPTNQHIKESLRNIQLITASIESQKLKLGLILDELESITKTFNENDENISASLKNISSITDSIEHSQIKSAILNLNNAAKETNNILTEINSGRGSVGKIVNSDSLYIQLNNVSKNLDQLITDLRQNPKKYVHFSIFGRKSK